MRKTFKNIGIAFFTAWVVITFLEIWVLADVVNAQIETESRVVFGRGKIIRNGVEITAGPGSIIKPGDKIVTIGNDRLKIVSITESRDIETGDINGSKRDDIFIKNSIVELTRDENGDSWITQESKKGILSTIKAKVIDIIGKLTDFIELEVECPKYRIGVTGSEVGVACSEDEDEGGINVIEGEAILTLKDSDTQITLEEGTFIGFDDIPEPPPGDPIVNHCVDLFPLEYTFRFKPTTECPDGYIGLFSFDSELINIDICSLSNLMVEVIELTNGNLIRNSDGGVEGVGSFITIEEKDEYSDGILNLGESVNITFEICVKEKKPFRFFVDLWGEFNPI